MTDFYMDRLSLADIVGGLACRTVLIVFALYSPLNLDTESVSCVAAAGQLNHIV